MSSAVLTVNHVVKDSNFSVCKRHSLCINWWWCNIAENLLREIVAWILRQFVSKLEFRVLVHVVVELFSISRLQRVCVFTVCAVCTVSVRFAPVRNCIPSGIALLDYRPTSLLISIFNQKKGDLWMFENFEIEVLEIKLKNKNSKRQSKFIIDIPFP